MRNLTQIVTIGCLHMCFGSDFSTIHGELDFINDTKWHGYYLIWNRSPQEPLEATTHRDWCKSAQVGAKQRPGGVHVHVRLRT